MRHLGKRQETRQYTVTLPGYEPAQFSPQHTFNTPTSLVPFVSEAEQQDKRED